MGERLLMFAIGKLFDWLIKWADKEIDLWGKADEGEEKYDRLKKANNKKDKINAARDLLTDT